MDSREKHIRAMLGKPVHVVVDRPKGYVHGDLVYPIPYGYIPGMMAGDGEEQDAYILGVDHPIEDFHGIVIGAIRRWNDVEDKLVVAPEGMVFHQAQIAEATRFQERFFQGKIIAMYHRSCGVLPWREQDGKKEYLIVFEHFSQCWSLPKGHIEAGETEVETAQRELQEETGLTAQLDASHHASITYPLTPVGSKQVVFFPGRVDGTPVAQPGEIQRCKWITQEQLHEHLFPDTVAACLELIATLP